MIELTVKFKGEDKKRHSQAFVVYEKPLLDQNDEIIQAFIKEARQSISWVPEETEITIKMDIV